MKRILMTMMFVVGLSGAAQAQITYLQCGSLYVAVDMEKKEIVETSFFNTIRHITKRHIQFGKKNKDNWYLQINRITLSYFTYTDRTTEGTCVVGRKF